MAACENCGASEQFDIACQRCGLTLAGSTLSRPPSRPDNTETSTPSGDLESRIAPPVHGSSPIVDANVNDAAGSQQGSPLAPGTSPTAPHRSSRRWVLLAVTAVVVIGGGMVAFASAGSGNDGERPSGATQAQVVATGQPDQRTTVKNPTDPSVRPSQSVINVRTTVMSVGTTPYEPVPLSATASCTAPEGLDAAGVTQSYEPAKAIDGKTETAWRCPGSAVGESLTIRFTSPVQLTSVGLIPGYDKLDPTDGADRFVQSPKVMRVRWTFDGNNPGVDAAPNGQRSMFMTPVSVRTSSVTLTIVQTQPGDAVTNAAGIVLGPLETTAISELAMIGVR